MFNDFTFVPKHYSPRTHEKMQEVLMDPNGVGPAVHYYMMRGSKEQKNITVMEPGTISGEYIKTYGHYHVGELEETYTVLYGEGIALLQKLFDDGSVEFRAIPIKSGDSVHMAPGWGHVIVNTGQTYFVTVDDGYVHFDESNPCPVNGHADYLPVKAMQGFAYYVVEYNGKPALKRNPKYTEIVKQDLRGIPLAPNL